MQTCVVILGMHRSGTSAMAGTLNILGVYLGENLLQGDRFNAKGYFENASLTTANIELLKSFNVDLDDVDLPMHWNTTPVALEYKDKIKQIFQSEFGNSDLFGIKDPRLCILLPLYLDIFNEMNIRPCFILIRREPAEVIKSLAAKAIAPGTRFVGVYKRYVTQMNEFTYGRERVVIDFSDLIKDTANTIKTIRNTLGLPLKEYGAVEDKLKDFLEPALKHHTMLSVDYIKELHGELERMKRVIEVQAAYIKVTEGSIAFSIIKTLWRAVDRVLPCGTRRRNFYDEILAAFKHSTKE